MILLGTATDDELLDPTLRPDDLLFRLFHEDGVRVFTPLALALAVVGGRGAGLEHAGELPTGRSGEHAAGGRRDHRNLPVLQPDLRLRPGPAERAWPPETLTMAGAPPPLLLSSCRSRPARRPRPRGRPPSIRQRLSADPPGRGQHRGRERAQYPAGMGFIARRRSEQLPRTRRRSCAHAWSRPAAATSRAPPSRRRAWSSGPAYQQQGVIASATEPNWGWWACLRSRSRSSTGWGSSRASPARGSRSAHHLQRAGVEAKDNFARTITADLIAASSRELETSIDQNLADRKAP